MLRHVTIGYTDSTLDIVPTNALHGSSVVGLYFGRESCPHCGPVLEDPRQLVAQRIDTSIILVPVGTTRAESKRYFGNLYDWLSVPYDGVVGYSLVDRFEIKTVPALILLDLGKVICINGRARLATDRFGHNFPWRVAAPHHRPAVNFDLPARARHRGLPLPPTQLHPAPTGMPPRCFTPLPATLPDPTAAATTGGAATQPADGLDRMADVHR